VAGRCPATSHRASRSRSRVAGEPSDICRARRDSPGSRNASGDRYADAVDAQTPRSSRQTPLTKRLADLTVRAGGSRDHRAHRAALVVMTSSAGGLLPRRNRLESTTPPTKIESGRFTNTRLLGRQGTDHGFHHPRTRIEHDHVRGLAECPDMADVSASDILQKSRNQIRTSP